MGKRISNVHKLTQKDAEELLFHQEMDDFEGLPIGPRPPQRWIDRNGPIQKTQIDRQIDKLPKRPEHELIRRNIWCPYFAARRAIAAATGHARAQKRLETGKQDDLEILLPPKQAGRYLQRYRKSAEKLSLELRSFKNMDHGYLEYDNISMTSVAFARTDTDRNWRTAKLVQEATDAMSATIEKLQQLATLAAEEAGQLIRRGPEMDRWRVAFVSRLGFFYWDLTGQAPTPKSPRFQTFVEQSYWALGGRSEKEWGGAIKTACSINAQDPRLNRWERYDYPAGPSEPSRRASVMYPNGIID